MEKGQSNGSMSNGNSSNGQSSIELKQAKGTVTGEISKELEEKLCLFEKRQRSTSLQLTWRDSNYSYKKQNDILRNSDDRKNYADRTNWREKNSMIDDRSFVGGKEHEYSRINSKFCHNEVFHSPDHELSSRYKGQTNPTFKEENIKENLPEGYWNLKCDDKITDENGLTELDRVFNLLNELYLEKPELFARKPEKYQSVDSTSCNCFLYMKNKIEKSQIKWIVDLLRVKLPCYNFTIRYCIKQCKKFSTVYLQTMDGDIYEFTDRGWTLAKI